ncbi:MAG: FAD-dependent oxidoreductase [Rubrivivax sp.]|nr:FAD-dependent oxidoreductase [Rubrivivax sp.]
MPRRLVVVGAGWAGLAAAVRAAQAGWLVTLLEMAPAVGGRARSVQQGSELRDNGQHILIGAYARTIDLMRSVGAPIDTLLARMPLALVDAQGRGLRLPGGAPLLSFARGVWAHPGWSLAERIALLRAATGWLLSGFRCQPDRPVAELCARMPPRVREQLVEPLCVAALNTPSAQASAAVFLRVLRDALFSGPGSADLLLPRRPLGELLPEPALSWLRAQGAAIRTGHRAHRLERQEAGAGAGWLVDGLPADAVILACSASEAARLSDPWNAAWSGAARAFAYEPIITAWIQAPQVRLPFPMLALEGGPAQFAFDLGALGQQPGAISLVVSGARPWVDAGSPALDAALAQQIDSQLGAALPQGWSRGPVITEKRATFRCTPALQRPPSQIAAGLLAAGDYIEGPYPATLEGAVRSGEAAAQALA